MLNNEPVNEEIEAGYHCAQARVQGEDNTKRASVYDTQIEASPIPGLGNLVPLKAVASSSGAFLWNCGVLL